MCGPLKRKGLLCKDCIDGFGVSLTSLGYQCSNCTSVWYGIPLYLIVQFLPATIFYLIILLSNIHLTSAPMTCFIVCIQLLMYDIIMNRRKPLESILPMIKHTKLFSIFLGFSSIWNSDYFNYVVPPFCFTMNLGLKHAIYFGYLSALYPFLLIFLTWIYVKLYDLNIISLRNVIPQYRCTVSGSRRRWNIRNGITNCFTSFFLLSFTKFLHQSFIVMWSPVIYRLRDKVVTKEHITNFDPTSRAHTNITHVCIGATILMVFNVIPVAILILYSLKCFRSCLSKCKLDSLALTAFVEKFNGCYKDGLDGGRDMRSFSGLYFVLVYVTVLHYYFHLDEFQIFYWPYLGFVFMVTAVLVGYFKPYKKTYMNILDTLLLVYMSVFYTLLARKFFFSEVVQFNIMLMIPVITFGLFVALKVIIKIFKHFRTQNRSLSNFDDQSQPLLPAGL